MNLPEKVQQLKLNTALAARYAAFWEKAIETHGADKATAFYSHLGLNHLEKKSYEYEGLTLSREPKEHEKIAVKGISDAQEAGKASVTAILLKLRTQLIDEALTAIKNLTPATYHELILTAPDDLRGELREMLSKIFKRGRYLVTRELSKQKDVDDNSEDEDDPDELDDLTDLTDSRILNDTQTRISSAAARYALLGLTGAALWKAVRDEMNAGSVSYIDRAAQGVANRVLNMGRSQEAEDRRDEWERVEYSALLDANCCDPCAADDGQEAANEADLTPVPSPDCLGLDACRCFHIFVSV